MTRLRKTLADILGPKGKISNQPSLAAAIASLLGQGIPSRLLPHEFHVRWQHLATGAVSSRNARLLHTLGFARRGPGSESAEEAMKAYHIDLLRHTRKVRSHRTPTWAERGASLLQIQDCRRLHRLIKSLYRKHVHALVA